MLSLCSRLYNCWAKNTNRLHTHRLNFTHHYDSRHTLGDDNRAPLRFCTATTNIVRYQRSRASILSCLVLTGARGCKNRKAARTASLSWTWFVSCSRSDTRVAELRNCRFIYTGSSIAALVRPGQYRCTGFVFAPDFHHGTRNSRKLVCTISPRNCHLQQSPASMRKVLRH